MSTEPVRRREPRTHCRIDGTRGGPKMQLCNAVRRPFTGLKSENGKCVRSTPLLQRHSDVHGQRHLHRRKQAAQPQANQAHAEFDDHSTCSTLTASAEATCTAVPESVPTAEAEIQQQEQPQPTHAASAIAAGSAEPSGSIHAAEWVASRRSWLAASAAVVAAAVFPAAADAAVALAPSLVTQVSIVCLNVKHMCGKLALYRCLRCASRLCATFGLASHMQEHRPVARLLPECSARHAPGCSCHDCGDEQRRLDSMQKFHKDSESDKPVATTALCHRRQPRLACGRRGWAICSARWTATGPPSADAVPIWTSTRCAYTFALVFVCLNATIWSSDAKAAAVGGFSPGRVGRPCTN